MKKYPTELQNYTEVVDYIRRCLSYEGKDTRPDIASWIVGLIANDHYHEWAKDRRYPELWQLVEVASGMEIPEMYEQDLVKYGLHDEYWQELKKLVDLFARKLEVWERIGTADAIIEYIDITLEGTTLPEFIGMAITALDTHEPAAQLLHSKKYPELTEILKIASEIENERVEYRRQEIERIRFLIAQAKHKYNAR